MPRYKQSPIVSEFVSNLSKETGLTKQQVTEALIYEMYKFSLRSYGVAPIVITNKEVLDRDKDR